ncbi:MAG: COX15/CtaA family protein [Hyphomicrobium sp.]
MATLTITLGSRFGGANGHGTGKGMASVSRIPQDSVGSDRAVARWLWFVAALVFAMVVVGGATRLTDSGLSITEWKPILGAVPPLSHADWETAFQKYRQIPEYHHVNKGMSLDEFKFIFWWEWAHRFLGRLVGFAFAIPLAVFWLRGALRPGGGTKYLGLLGLGALQGGIGWYMVSSGLVERVDVSQYRLALHLGVAFLILGCLVWLALDLAPSDPDLARSQVTTAQKTLAAVLVAAVFLQVLLGALVAGLKAGLAFNTWPDMNGELIPSGIAELSPWYLNLFENVAAVQFNHRVMAYVVTGLALANLWLMWGHVSSRLRRSAVIVTATVLLQAVLGIATLLMAVPLWLGLVHQAGAAVLLALAVRHWHLVRRAESRSLQPLASTL